MTDRTTCFGCVHLVWAVTKARNVYFYCQHHKQVVGKLKPKVHFLIKPRPPIGKKCKYKPRPKKGVKPQSIFSRFLGWVKKVCTVKKEAR